MTDPTAAERCPRCNSPEPKLHPAMQFEGEVQICPDPWHQPTDPTAEPSQRDQYREKIRQALALAATSGRLPVSREPLPLKSIADMILAVRDAEMEQLRAEYDDLLSQRAMWWNSVSAERQRLVAQRDGLARRASLMRRNYIETAATEERLRAELGTQIGRAEALQVALWERTQQRNARDAELAGMRERAETAIDLIDEYDGPDASFEDHPKWAAVRDVLRAAPEPATPPTVSTIVDRATGERHEYPQQEANERACECGHPVSRHGCEGCVHLVDGEYCECPTPHGGDTEEDTDA